MPTYVFYHRTYDGLIERWDSIISDRPSMVGSYPYKQNLVGFPEAVVFWADATGESIGVAPVSPPQNGE